MLRVILVVKTFVWEPVILSIAITNVFMTDVGPALLVLDALKER